MEVIIACMDSIQTEEENISLKDETKEEINRFIDSMNSEQFEKITSFVQGLPTMTHDVTFTCTNCGEHNEHTLRGLDDFF